MKTAKKGNTDKKIFLIFCCIFSSPNHIFWNNFLLQPYFLRNPKAIYRPKAPETYRRRGETDLSASGAKRQAEGGEDYTGSKQYRADLSDWRMDSGQYQGIGTVTYYDAENGTFGALGHGVYDVDTDELMVIHGGSVVDTTLTEIVKGEKGAAGELIGQVEMQEKLAVIEKNTETGIYGKAAAGVFAGESYPVATKAEEKRARLCCFPIWRARTCRRMP